MFEKGRVIKMEYAVLLQTYGGNKNSLKQQLLLNKVLLMLYLFVGIFFF